MGLRSSFGVLITIASLTALSACTAEAPTEAVTPEPVAPFAALSRVDFNQKALGNGLPWYWRDDANNNSRLDPDELVIIWGVDESKRADWVSAEGFTPKFTAAYDALVKTPAPTDPRHVALAAELGQGRFTAVETRLANPSDEDRAILTHVAAAARAVERLYMRQLGTLGLDANIPAGDGLGKVAFYLNQGPWCSGPKTESDPNCRAIDNAPTAKIFGTYPRALQETEPKFCEVLSSHKDHKALLDPFTVVVEKDKGQYAAVPYSEYFKDDMAIVKTELEAAAAAIQDPKEKPFQEYLRAAAKAFGDNRWFDADEAWAKMSVHNSKWYLRIGPDEVYWEPCNRKAGFHVSFARINEGSLAWQNKLEPIKNELEKTLAGLAGAPYKPRPVAFHLPDFIDIVLNAGDSRDARGATVGQSLPNWGPVADGRGRTVVMANLYTDPDSRQILRRQAESMLCSDAMPKFTDSEAPHIASTVLHEAAHNLGPSHEYRVRGKTDDEVFGGPLASMLEEFKAEMASAYFPNWLVGKGLMTQEEADQTNLRIVLWAFGHISRGLYDADKKPKPYSQLSAIMIGYYLEDGAVTWRADAKAHNGADTGCLSVDFQKLPATIEKLTALAAGFKARGDRTQAEALKAQMVDGPGIHRDVFAVATERWSREPRPSFVYGFGL